LANPYLFSIYFCDNFGDIFAWVKQAEELAKKNSNEGVRVWSKDKK
jgi:hypothetical protein